MKRYDYLALLLSTNIWHFVNVICKIRKVKVSVIGQAVGKTDITYLEKIKYIPIATKPIKNTACFKIAYRNSTFLKNGQIVNPINCIHTQLYFLYLSSFNA